MTPEARLKELLSIPEIREYVARTPELTAKMEELIMSKLIKFRELIGRDAFNRWLIVTLYLDNNDPTEHDETLILEQNGFESTQQRVDAMGIVDTNLAVLYEKCTNFVARFCLDRMLKGRDVSVRELEYVATKMGVFRNDCELLWEECAKSAADLCLKKMRVGALVDKLDKKTTLMYDIVEIRMQGKLLHQRIRAFQTKLRPLNELVARIRISSRAASVVQLNHYIVDDKQTNNLQDDEDEVKESAFWTESIRVLRELMKGVKIEDEEDSRVDEPRALADEWALAWVEKCLNKVSHAYLVERRLLFEVLKSEIAETKRMEKQVHDRFVIYQTSAHQGSAANEQGNVVGGDQRKHLNERFGFVWQNLGLLAVATFAAVGIVAVAGLTKGQ